MKQKLFENIGGNQFKLISENTNKNSDLIREGLRKIFSSANGRDLSYKSLANIGMGYIKDVSEARKCALQEARQLAEEFGYQDDENNAKFVKGDESSVEENREIQIGKDIINKTQALVNYVPQEKWGEIVTPIQALAKELIRLHTK